MVRLGRFVIVAVNDADCYHCFTFLTYLIAVLLYLIKSRSKVTSFGLVLQIDKVGELKDSIVMLRTLN